MSAFTRSLFLMHTNSEIVSKVLCHFDITIPIFVDALVLEKQVKQRLIIENILVTKICEDKYNSIKIVILINFYHFYYESLPDKFVDKLYIL